MSLIQMFRNLCPVLPRLLTPSFVNVWLHEPYLCEKYFVCSHIPTKCTAEKNELELFTTTKCEHDLNEHTDENIFALSTTSRW